MAAGPRPSSSVKTVSDRQPERNIPMSISIYAARHKAHPEFGTVISPVIDFSAWDAEILADDAEDRSDRGESAFIPNPAYEADAGMTLANGNAHALACALGFDLGDEGIRAFPIDEVYAAALKARNGAPARTTRPDIVSRGALGATFIDCGMPADKMESYLGQLLRIIAKGRDRGATHVDFC